MEDKLRADEPGETRCQRGRGLSWVLYMSAIVS
jgi:hypothetical protein